MSLPDSFLQDLATAIRSHEFLPAFPPGLSLGDAYRGLSQMAPLVCDDKPVGIKAGLTNPDIQQLFGLDHALLGFLYDWGELRSSDPVLYRANAQLECEVAITVDQAGNPKAIAPAIEIVFVNFLRPEDMTPPNLVLSSLGADRFLVGEPVPWDDVDFDAIESAEIAMSLSGDEILKASPHDSLGGPRDAWRWCINEARRRGFQFSEDSVLLCGTCGAGLPMRRGSYAVDFGPLGSIEFSVEA